MGALSALTGETILWANNGTFFNPAYPVPVTGQDDAGTEVGGDGHVLSFSMAELTAADADGGAGMSTAMTPRRPRRPSSASPAGRAGPTRNRSK